MGKSNTRRILEFVLGLAILVLAGMMIYPTFYQGDKMGPKQYTRAQLARLNMYFLKFNEDAQRWPTITSWQTELAPYFAKDPVFQPKEVLIDKWSNQIRYEIKTNDGKVIRYLRSSGPNKTDEGGHGDDIEIQIH